MESSGNREKFFLKRTSGKFSKNLSKVIIVNEVRIWCKNTSRRKSDTTMTRELTERLQRCKNSLSRSKAILKGIRDEQEALREHMKNRYWTKKRKEARDELAELEGIYEPLVVSEERRVTHLTKKAESEV